jgi:diacylglycerol kinase family enzyme
MRALLVVNPKATVTSARLRDVLVRALRSEVDLDVVYTKRRGHAAKLARDAADQHIDVVVTLGGDGTVNEAINGLLADGPSADLPALAVVPGGSTNVFVRALGLPRDWAEATGAILEGLREGRRRLVSLGRADDRYFCFCAGLGIDAEVIRKVEQARLRGSTSTPLLYLRSLTVHYLLQASHREPALTIEVPGHPSESGIATAIIQNTAPWTFLGERAVHASPDASFDGGLDLLALRELNPLSTARTVTQLLLSANGRRSGSAAGSDLMVADTGTVRGRQVVHLHDQDEFTIRASRPTAFQLDGDYLGEREKVRFTAIREALRVVV